MEHIFNTKKPRVIRPLKFKDVCPTKEFVPTVREELAFFDATPSFIRQYKEQARLTHKILQKVFRELVPDGDDYHHLIINSHRHYLAQEGMHPYVPGWHCDYSRQRTEEEKTLVEEGEDVIHWMIVFGTNDPPTYQFIDKHDIHLRDEKLRKHTWKTVSEYFDRKVNSGWKTKRAKKNEVLEFRGNTLYKICPTDQPCWRYQLRVTLYPKGHPYRPDKPTHGNVRQVQMVYVDAQSDW